MNDGRTIVYVNDSATFNNTGLQTNISLVDIAFGTATIAVVYEAAGSTCSIRTETTVEGQLVINWSCFHFQVSACACTCMFSILLHNAPSTCTCIFTYLSIYSFQHSFLIWTQSL